MNLKQVYDQVLTEIPSIEIRNFINRFNQAVNDLAIRYPSSMPIIQTEIDTNNDYTKFTWNDFDNAGLNWSDIDLLHNTWTEFEEGNGFMIVNVRDDGIYPIVYPLPKDCAGVYRVYRVCTDYKYECKDYTVDTAGIRFEYEGIYQVHYYQKTEIQTINDAVMIPWQFFNAMVYFIIGNELMDTNDKKAMLKMKLYDDSAKQANQNIKSQKTRNMRMKQPVWR